MTKFKGNYNYVLLDSMWHNFPVWKRPKIIVKQPREGYLTRENRKGSTRETPEGTIRETPGRYLFNSLWSWYVFRLRQINFLFVANVGFPVLPLFKTISF